MNKSLKTDNLIAGYKTGVKKKVVLEGITFDVKPGTVLTLIGPNGSGKSTILKTITNQLDKLGGNIIVNETNMDNLKENDIAKTMSMVMTGRLKTDLMTSWEVVATGRYPYTGMLGILSEEDKKMVNEAIDLVHANDVSSDDFNSISDGQRQRIMLARALCQEPDILVLDEPTSFLDIKYKIDILENIRAMSKKKNIAVIMSLHELDFAKNMSDYILAVADGKVYGYGKPDEIFTGNLIQKLYGIDEDRFNPATAGIVFNKSVEKVSDAIDFEKALEDKSEALKNKKTKVIMIQGTMSNAGKSLLVAGLCRVFMKDGFRVAPFKSQNMALNSYVTEDGLEMGRAQVMQAECAGIKPHVCMNPVLLKPTDDKGSQVIVNGKSIGNMPAREYFEYKTKLIPDIMKAYDTLSQMADIIVVEGAGSPAEINLKKNDIVNMGLAKMLDAPVLLVGDIDRGGVFAQLLGTLELLTDDERKRVKGLIINKFRGDKTILDPGITMLEEKGNVKVTGVIPYMNINVEDEDSLSERFNVKEVKSFDIVVIRYPHISNFTDFDTFEQIDDVSVRYVSNVREFGNPDMVILPGSKNTISDLKYLYDSGLSEKIKEAKDRDVVIFGICGGYQMLGAMVEDKYCIEGGGTIKGLGLLDVNTVLNKEKVTKQYKGKITSMEGIFSELSLMDIEGYEIHMGDTVSFSNDNREFTSGNTGFYKGNVYGTYIHGIFDKGVLAGKIVETVALKNKKNVDVTKIDDYKLYKEKQYDILEKTVREYMDMEYIYKLFGIKG